MNVVIKSLKDKEKGLISILESTPAFKQLEALRVTILLYENDSQENNISTPENISQSQTISDYDADNLTWKEKTLYVINKLGLSGVSDIVSEIQKYEPTKTKTFLDKRISATLNILKKEGSIDVKKEGRKGKYFIK